MSSQSRLGDITIGIGSHSQGCCMHILVGIRVTGSRDTTDNSRDLSRAGIDLSIHDCPHCAVNMCLSGSPNVFTNGYPNHRVGDIETEFCGIGVTVTGSPDTFTNG